MQQTIVSRNTFLFTYLLSHLLICIVQSQSPLAFPTECTVCNDINPTFAACLEESLDVIPEVDEEAGEIDFIQNQIPLVQCTCPAILRNQACSECMLAGGEPANRWIDAVNGCSTKDYRSATIGFMVAFEILPPDDDGAGAGDISALPPVDQQNGELGSTQASGVGKLGSPGWWYTSLAVFIALIYNLGN